MTVTFAVSLRTDPPVPPVPFRQILVVLAAANRDPGHCDRPHVFDPERADGRSFDGGPLLRNMYKIKQPTSRLVFIDDFGEDWDAAWAVCWSRPAWWNPIPARHGAGTTVAFADGHSEWWAWKDQRTVELMAKWDWASRGDNLNVEQRGNPDLMQVQKAVWGELGYTYNSGS